MSSICFVSSYSASVLFPGIDDHIGGAEEQQHYLAEALHAKGFDVSFVIHDHCESRERSHPRFSIFRSYQRNSGLKFLRYLYPQFFKVWCALEQADAEFYYVRGMRLESGIAWLYCLVRKRKYIAAIAHDRECNPSTLPMYRFHPTRLMFGVSLRRAYLVLAQSAWQKAEILSSFGVDAEVVSNAMPLDSRAPRKVERIEHVLWVGTIVPHKRPEIFIELARKKPSVRFTMIGPGRLGLKSYKEEIKRLASEVQNIEFIDFVPLSQVQDFFHKSDLVILTSNFEGFPNVLLHAWASGRAVITSCDPDRIVATNALGFVVNDVDDFDGLLSAFVAGHELDKLQERGRNARNYLITNHTPDAVANKLLDAICNRK